VRHQVAGSKLGRDIKSRKALLNNLTDSLFLHGQITTTFAKAKFVQSYAERMITVAKKNRLAAKRKIASSIGSKSFEKLLSEIVPGFATRSGGYTRIIKLSHRTGDNAPMAKIALLAIDKSKIANSKKTTTSQKQKKASTKNSAPSVVARKSTSKPKKAKKQ